jgi:hypothetical protein
MGTSKKKGQKLDEVELVPDAWSRFEKFIREIVKAGPQHRAPTTKPKAKANPKAMAPKKRGRQAKAIDEESL